MESSQSRMSAAWLPAQHNSSLWVGVSGKLLQRMSEKLIQSERFQANIWRFISYTRASSHRAAALRPAR